MDTIGTVDLVLLAVLALSAVVGLWRGLVFELMSLFGWLVAYAVAQAYSAQLGVFLPVGTPGSAMHQAAAFFVTFVGAMVAWVLLSRLVRMAVQATPLTVPDRLLGGGFGLLRGLVGLLVVATIVALTPAARSPTWTESRGAGLLALVLQGLKPMLPIEVSRHLPA